MLNRLLCLFLSVVAPLGAVLVWVSGAHAGGGVALAARAPALALAAISILLALWHLREAPRGSVPTRATAWLGLATYFVACATSAPHVGAWLGLTVAALALSSVTGLIVERMKKRLVRVERRARPSFA